MMDIDAVRQLADAWRLWVVEDAAHAFPAAWRRAPHLPWRQCGEGTADVTCFSFYANKTITTGEGGMAVTDRADLADRMRLMSLHGLSHDAWARYSGGGSWDYQIVAPVTNTTSPTSPPPSESTSSHVRRRCGSSASGSRSEYLRGVRGDRRARAAGRAGQLLPRVASLPGDARAGSAAIDRDEFIKELRRRGVSAVGSLAAAAHASVLPADVRV